MKPNPGANAPEKDDFYVLVIDRNAYMIAAPRGQAYRRDKRYAGAETREVACPCCTKLFMTVDESSKVTVVRIPRNARLTASQRAKARTCGICHTKVYLEML